MKGQTLFLGNSLNQLTPNKISWRDVMYEVDRNVRSGSPMPHLGAMPFPFAFDGFTLAARDLDPDEEDSESSSRTKVKKIVAEPTKKLNPNPHHSQILALGCRHVLTTNYDYALELAATGKTVPASGELTEDHIGKDKTEHGDKYSLFRRRLVPGGAHIWHVHGEALNARSVMLGHEHYVGALERMRQYVKTGSNYHKRSSPFRGQGADYDENKGHGWLDVFFRDDVHIAGLGLDYSEVDLWWALYYKERLRNNPHQVGKTFFYAFDLGHALGSAEATVFRAKCELLKSLRVEVQEVRMRKTSKGQYDWLATWDQLISLLGNNMH